MIELGEQALGFLVKQHYFLYEFLGNSISQILFRLLKHLWDQVGSRLMAGRGALMVMGR
jgi:hypothetical protein